MEGGTVEVGTSAPVEMKPEPKTPEPELEAATKMAAKEITLLVDRSNKRAVDIPRGIYKLADLLQEQGKDWNLAAAAVHVDPEELSA